MDTEALRHHPDLSPLLSIEGEEASIGAGEAIGSPAAAAAASRGAAADRIAPPAPTGRVLARRPSHEERELEALPLRADHLAAQGADPARILPAGLLLLLARLRTSLPVEVWSRAASLGHALRALQSLKHARPAQSVGGHSPASPAASPPAPPPCNSAALNLPAATSLSGAPR